MVNEYKPYKGVEQHKFIHLVNEKINSLKKGISDLQFIIEHHVMDNLEPMEKPERRKGERINEIMDKA